MKIILLIFVECLAYFARNIPGAISLQNRIRQEHSNHSHDRCLFRGKYNLVKIRIFDDLLFQHWNIWVNAMELFKRWLVTVNKGNDWFSGKINLY